MRLTLSPPSPARLLILTFMFLIAVGTLMLLQPSCTPDGRPLDIVSAFFTATSAVCVTGLIVLDTAKDFSAHGQLVILLLIQLGGLGILTISNWMWLALRRKASPYDRFLVAQTIGSTSRLHPREVLRRVFAYTFAFELAGAVLLTARFAFDMPFGRALWFGVFHSVSAFCNAGFSLFSDSLTGYSGDLLVNGVMMVLIVSGGIGFLVAADVADVFLSRKRDGFRWRSLSYQSRVVLLTTGVLLAAGALVFMALEWHNTLAHFRWYQRPLIALFHSVTCRTAGFNTVDVGALTNTTLMITIILMIIGASPGSTGGGIKTTTAAVLWANVFSRIRGRPRGEMLDRSFASETNSRAVAVTAAYLAIIVVALVLLQHTEFGYAPHSSLDGGFRFLDHLFEVASALGTVGLSTGVTPTLSAAGKMVIIVCMFAGRVGPLLLAQVLVPRKAPLAYSLPHEKVMIG